MSSTSALQARVAALAAGTQPTPPASDPIVVTSVLTTGLATKAPLASPSFTGIPTAPTAVPGSGTNQLATTQFVATAIAAVPTSGGGVSGAPTSRQILSGGLATGGGDLTADRTITVPKATQADVATGADDTKALTALATAAAFAAKAPNTIPALFTNGAPAIITDLFAEFLTGKKFGLQGNSTDETAKLNYAIAQAVGTGKRLELAAGYYGVNPSATDRCLTASTVPNIRGEAGERTVIFPMSGATTAHSILKIKPTSSALMEYVGLSDLMIYPGASGTKYGGKAIEIDTTGVTGGLNLSSFLMERVYCAAGNDYSVVINNTAAAQAQGCPNNSSFIECSFYEGFYGRGMGDSNSWTDCVFRSSSTSRSMIDLALLDVSGNGASVAIFERPNIGGLGGVVIRGGRHFIFREPNAELGNEAGSIGSPSGALFDIRGDISRVHRVSIKGGVASIFGNSTATRLIRIDNVHDADIDEIELSNGTSSTLASAIEITANATNAHVGWIPSLDVTKFTNLVADAGTGTRGVTKTPASLGTGWTNLGSGYAPASFRRDRYGVVSLDGVLVASGVTTGGAIFTLPVGFLPSQGVRRGASALINGSYTAAPVDVLISGAVVYQGTTPVTQLSLGGISFQSASFHTST